jgi:hypothetical protein
MKVTRFEFFESGQGLVGVRLGFIPLTFLVKYDMYKTYQDLVSKGEKEAEAKKKIVKQTGYNYAQVIRAIHYFKEDLQISAQTPVII